MNFLALLACLGSFVLLWGVLWRAHADWRGGFLSASIVWATALVAITELLSLFHVLTFAAALIAWALCFVIALMLWLRTVGDPRNLWKDVPLDTLSVSDRWLLLASAVIAVLLGVVAFLAPPNTYDSLAYHMPRLMRWIQDRSLAFYPTPILRQLYLVPGAEFVILHLTLLAGSDRLANFAQWFAMLGSGIGVSLIARQLGSGVRGQVLSAVAVITLPMGILQATSTQNDYVIGFWLVAFACSMIMLRRNGDAWSAFAAGASLGLAVLTKSTAYIYALPLLVWLSLGVLRGYRVRAVWLLGLVALLTVLVNLGTYVRETRLFGNPLGITQEPSIVGGYSNDVFSPAGLASNVLRNAGLQMQTPSSALNARITQAVNGAQRSLGLVPDDPRFTWSGAKFNIESISFVEDSEGNPLHFILVVVAAALICARRDLRSRLLPYLLCLLAAFLLFCLVLKWQPWNSRLELPLFLLFAPLLGAAADVLHPKWLPVAVAVVLLVASLPWVFLNRVRPLVGERSVLTTDRNAMYFRYNTDTLRYYAGSASFLAKRTGGQCRQVGLYLNANDMEYPFWVLLQRAFPGGVTIASVAVDNLSVREYAAFPLEAPCGIISTYPVLPGGMQVGGRTYLNARTFGTVTVLLPHK